MPHKRTTRRRRRRRSNKTSKMMKTLTGTIQSMTNAISYGNRIAISGGGKSMSKKIYYTGIGSNKSGVHTEQEFLNIMNKTFKKDCIDYCNDLKCKDCKEYTKQIKNYSKQMAKSLKKNQTVKEKIKNTMKIINKINKLKNNKKLNELKNKCLKCKSNSNRTNCNLNEYIKFSGAEIK